MNNLEKWLNPLMSMYLLMGYLATSWWNHGIYTPPGYIWSRICMQYPTTGRHLHGNVEKLQTYYAIWGFFFFFCTPSNPEGCLIINAKINPLSTTINLLLKHCEVSCECTVYGPCYACLKRIYLADLNSILFEFGRRV